MSYISTATGGRFYFDAEQIVKIEDIGCALSNLCRFTGQIWDFYSIAEHSWHTSYLVPPEHALCALLHDATEAYCNDLARPFKRMLPDYMAAEDRIWRKAVAPTFGLPAELPECVKQADMAMLKMEVNRLYPSHVAEELNLPGEPAPRALRLWAPKQARYFFMKRYEELTLAA